MITLVINDRHPNQIRGTIGYASRIITHLFKMIEKYHISIDNDSPISWGWYHSTGELHVYIHNQFKFFNLTEEEIEEFATTSCGPALWVLRTLAYRLGIPVRVTDKLFYGIMESRQ